VVRCQDAADATNVGANANPRRMDVPDRAPQRPSEKKAGKSLKEKREAKKEKQAGKKGYGS
jgi:hypothetical protein